MVKVLVVDDEDNVCELVRLYLQKEGYHVLKAHDGLTGLGMVEREKPDIIILDIMLPEMNGWDVCRKIRQTLDVPIIMLTARTDEVDRIMGLEMGADDYVTKPFSPGELVARVRAILRRASVMNKADTDFVRFDSLELYYEQRKVLFKSEELVLTPKEFDLLWFMANNPGHVFSREQILEKVWGYDFFGDGRTVDAHIKRLRRKLDDDPENPCFIHTVWGVGYKFEEKTG
jgi:two-component system response regulator ResD